MGLLQVDLHVSHRYEARLEQILGALNVSNADAAKQKFRDLLIQAGGQAIAHPAVLASHVLGIGKGQVTILTCNLGLSANAAEYICVPKPSHESAKFWCADCGVTLQGSASN